MRLCIKILEMIINQKRTYLFFAILALLFLTLTTGYAGVGKKSQEIIVNVNIYESSGETGFGFYRIDPETRERKLVNAPSAAGLSNVRISQNGKYVLGQKFNRKHFITELFLANIQNGSTYNLIMIPDNMVCHTGKPCGTFDTYGFTPDSKNVVISFPSGVSILDGVKETPLVPKEIGKGKYSVTLIDIRRWTETKEKSSFLILDAFGFPSFSPDGKRFVVPIKGSPDSKMKAMLYEIEPGMTPLSERIFGYELPFVEISQASFASENLIYILSRDELILYDVIGSRILKQETIAGFNISGSGYKPPHVPVQDEFSFGVLGFGSKRFAFVSSAPRYKSVERVLEGGPGDDDSSGYNKLDRDLTLLFGDSDSPSLSRIPFKKLPAKAGENSFTYFHLYFPTDEDKKAVLFLNSWNFQGFSVVDFQKMTMTEFVPGFFVGMSDDTDSVIYSQCGVDNSESFKGYSNFRWETLLRKSVKVGVRTNKLYYWDLDTDTRKILIVEPSYTSEAFFLN
jgi:hypothetical protein